MIYDSASSKNQRPVIKATPIRKKTNFIHLFRDIENSSTTTSEAEIYRKVPTILFVFLFFFEINKEIISFLSNQQKLT